MPQEETRAAVFNELLRTYADKMHPNAPTTMVTIAVIRTELAAWRKRYRQALVDD